MTDFRAIAGASRSLRTLLLDRIGLDGDFRVTIAPPDVEIEDAGGRRLNLYLYQLTENATLRNQEIPGHGHPAAYGQPPLSLDLHYLLTAHGRSETTSDADLEAQEILGAAMRVLHDSPILTENLIGGAGQPILDDSLRGEFERVKITLQPMDLEDLSKLWTALPEANFRRSVAYQVSVVQIESRRPRRFPKPVGEPDAAGPRVVAVPFRNPQIRELRVVRQGDPEARERPFPHARIGDTLIVLGNNLGGEGTRVSAGPLEVTATATIQERRIEVVLPDDEALQPGPQTVKVQQDVPLGDPPEPHAGFASNLGVFLLVPRVDRVEVDGGILRVTGSRLLDPERESLTLLGDRVIPASDYADASSPQEISFELPADLGSGVFGVRVRVHGTESLERRNLRLP